MPSPKILEKKKQVVKQLANELKDAQSIVLADYMGLNVAQDTEMRTAFREAGVNYRVIKNSVISRAFDQLGIDGFTDELTGPTAIAYSVDDIVLAPKLTKQYADKLKKFEIKGGIMEGAKVDLEQIIKLASIPDQQTLYGQLVSGLIFPVTSLAMTLNALAEKAAEEGKEKVADLVVASKVTADAKSETVEAVTEEVAEATKETEAEAVTEEATEKAEAKAEEVTTEQAETEEQA
ncbi:MAG: 50S ribosomal protein L10 [Saccharofermentanales bacterium]|jgi:large subunit ribosomal protein L10